MTPLPRTISGGFEAGVSRRGENVAATQNFHRSLTSQKSDAQEKLAGWRKWATKSLRLGQLGRSQSPRSRDRGAD